MREILFRGKRLDNGKWVQGFLVIWGNDYYIAPDINAYTSMGGRGKGRCMMFGHYYQVLPETVGQYTGLTDKNGKKIFEGDIVKFPHGTKSMNGKIEYIEEDCIYYLTYKTSRVPFGVFFNGFELEIIGNIHDNPELLEEEEE